MECNPCERDRAGVGPRSAVRNRRTLDLMFREFRARSHVSRRERELASAARAGSWSRRRALELQYRYVRRGWPRLAIFCLLMAAFSTFVLFVPERFRSFALGAWLAAVAGVVVHLVVVYSGSATFLVGDLGEQWTHDELRHLAGRSWKIVHRVLFRAAEDIDHVLIGPGGVVVVETKWSADDWRSRRMRPRIADAAAQVQENARVMKLVLRSVLGDAPVRSIVALWPGDPELLREHIGDTVVMGGQELRQWVESLPENELSPDAITRAWSVVAEHLARRDAADVLRLGPPPASPWQAIQQAAEAVSGFVLGAYAGATVVSWLPTPWLVAIGLAPAVIAWRFRRSRRVLLTAFAVGDVVLVVLLVIVATIASVT